MTPKHIPNRCADCGGPLALRDDIRPPEDGIRFEDEFACPAGCEGVYLDLSPAEVDELRAALADREPVRTLAVG
jgi:hypothetical protein